MGCVTQWSVPPWGRRVQGQQCPFHVWGFLPVQALGDRQARGWDRAVGRTWDQKVQHWGPPHSGPPGRTLEALGGAPLPAGHPDTVTLPFLRGSAGAAFPSLMWTRVKGAVGGARPGPAVES